MKDSSILKNELIFDFAAGNTDLSKSLLASTYLFLNSAESSLYSEFNNYCGEELKNSKQIQPAKLVSNDCISNKKFKTHASKTHLNNPLHNFIKNINDIKWKKIFTGFYEYSINNTSLKNIKLIKMNPGTKVPLHSHNGKEYILVLEGSFCDEFGIYSKGDLQINDYKIKHTPVACNDEGCVCLTVTEEDLVFYGPFAPLLNIVTFIKSIFFK